MKQIILMIATVAIFAGNIYAHTAFTLVSSEKKTVKSGELAAMEKQQTAGKKDKTNLSFIEKEIKLVAITGPEADMLSYRIQGVRNPNLVVPSGATIRLLFINIDGDMRHDIRFGHIAGAFDAVVDTADTAGTEKLGPEAGGVYQAEEIVIKAVEDGAYKYFCSVRGHAKGGMWSNIFVGVQPGASIVNAEKMTHVHSAGEEMDHDHAAPASPAKPAEHDHHNMATPTPPDQKKPSDDMAGMPGMEDMGHGSPDMKMAMTSTVNIGEPMSREGSGTSWIPDSSPMHAYMKMYKDGGMLMVHGTVFARYTAIGGSRDASVAGKGSRSRFDAPTMFMLMYTRPLTKRSQLGIRTMVSLDPLIERGYGYPLLYQTGELYRGVPIHDRQHPHDLFSELAATYSYKFDDKNSFYFYAGYPGEPALGPPAYMHRPSAANDPDAPIGHHWEDSSHITFGVLTAGFTHEKIKFEVSAFNGTEPDENRWSFDTPKINSFSGRLSYNPTKSWSFQISHGYLEFPERSEPQLKVLRRTTASAMYNKTFSDDRNWANSFVWGQNYSDEGRSNAFLFESNYEFGKNALFGRLENVQKDAHELVLPAPHPEGNFRVGAYSIGYLRDIVKDKGIDVGIGAKATLNTNPNDLAAFYGGTTHGGWQVFMRFRASKHAN